MNANEWAGIIFIGAVWLFGVTTGLLLGMLL